MRLFVAVELTDEARAAIAAEQRKIVAAMGSEALKVVRPEHMHLTLVFIGEVSEGRGAAIGRAMTEDVLLSPYRLTFGGTGVFPPHGPPRILWLGVVDGDHETIELQQIVARRLEALGVEPERRPIHPHLTLGRWRDGRPSDRLRVPTSTSAVTTIEVARVSLYQSRLSSTGPTYNRLAQAALRCQSSP